MGQQPGHLNRRMSALQLMQGQNGKDAHGIEAKARTNTPHT